MDKVSIIVPVYNAEDFLAEAIQSLLDQDYPFVEVIVINDGSTDSSEQEILKFSDKITYICQENQGQAQSLNTGWAESTGSILGYLSADDVLLPTCISESVKHIANHTGTYCDYLLIDKNSKPIQTVQAPDYSKTDLIEKMLCQPGPGALFHRDVFEKTKGWDVTLRQMPDYDFWLQISEFGDLKRVPKVLAHYRVHDESQTFMPPSYEKAEEPIKVMNKFSDSTAKSQARSHILSARLHAKSLRIIAFKKHCFKALMLDPQCFLNLDTWRLILSGWFSKLVFKLKNGAS